MAKGGKKYRLLLYEHILNRWWPTTLTLAIAIFMYVGVFWGAEWYFTEPGQNLLPELPNEGGNFLLVVGGLAILFTIFLLIVRKMAYVQLYADHIKLATPFMRLNVSYKRIQRTTTAQIANLFPPQSLSGAKRDVIAPISGNTAIVVHLTSYPLSRRIIGLFFSPLFFYDKTPHFVLVVDDWMRFSGELDSRRVSGKMPQKAPTQRISSGLLDDLRKK